jgi:hypothetical protein
MALATIGVTAGRKKSTRYAPRARTLGEIQTARAIETTMLSGR